jgi:hypothetical protein
VALIATGIYIVENTRHVHNFICVAITINKKEDIGRSRMTKKIVRQTYRKSELKKKKTG